MKKELTLRTIVLISIAFILISFLGLHGTLSSGFHFVDNHEVVQINKDLSDFNGNLFKVINKWINYDIGGRFRPMYLIDNVIIYTLFRGNFFLISLFHAILHIFIAFFLFLSIRKLGFRLFESLIFPLVALIGIQSVIWWRLGPNETIGMWYLSLTLVFMIYAIKSKKKNTMFRVLFCIAGALMILSKESFLLLTPAIILSYLSLEKLESENSSWLTVLKKHFLELGALLFLFIASIVFILMKVNTENLGYAGIKGVNLMAYLSTFGKLFSEGGIGIVSFIIFCISGIVSYRRGTNKRKALTYHILVLLISLCIVLPQSFLYAKSGIFERYFLPGMLAWAFMLAFSLNYLKQVIEPRLNKKYSSTFLIFEIVLLLSLLVPRLFIVSKEATKFTKEGKEVNTVLSMITENVHPNETIVFIADPVTDFERTISFRRYLGGISGLTKMYTYPVAPVNPDAFGQSLIQDFHWIMGGEEMHFNHIADKKSVEVIVTFPLLNEKGDSIASSLGFDMSEFNSFKIGSYKLYFRIKNDINLFSEVYKTEALLPHNSIYNEKSFFPEKYIKKGDSVQIIIRPSSEIKAQMSAFIILLDAANPGNIAVHQQIFGTGKINISKFIATDIEKPWLIYRNWGREQSIPSADISLIVKPNISFIVKTNSQINIPIR